MRSSTGPRTGRPPASPSNCLTPRRTTKYSPRWRAAFAEPRGSRSATRLVVSETLYTVFITAGLAVLTAFAAGFAKTLEAEAPPPWYVFVFAAIMAPVLLALAVLAFSREMPRIGALLSLWAAAMVAAFGAVAAVLVGLMGVALLWGSRIYTGRLVYRVITTLVSVRGP